MLSAFTYTISTVSRVMRIQSNIRFRTSILEEGAYFVCKTERVNGREHEDISLEALDAIKSELNIGIRVYALHSPI